MKHLDEVGETYSEHFLFASRVGLLMIFGGLAAFVHAICPWWFARTGSNAIQTINAMLENRHKVAGNTRQNSAADANRIGPEDSRQR